MANFKTTAREFHEKDMAGLVSIADTATFFADNPKVKTLWK